ncbi:SGNH/GDSL hydrolase family protein [Bradyrhizobium sp. S69]|uniref:SGNH/GDSL hydrolase family protein n=1 Tax=Bradyrhizobium sp. S69 TaxID=1641856 RepID=UPI00131E66B0|nr:SGNH/GDSL hydrolase family protein [Bradyrhizobium sp. S69]
MPDAPGSCDPHLDIVGFQYPLLHLKDALKSRRKVKVVAIGSSSTAGADGVLPFPPTLEMLLRQKFYGRMIDVINRGIGGQEAPEELSRFESDAIGEVPSLLIWQVGTNAVYHYQDYSPDEVAAAIEVGLGQLSGLPMDVVLMDLQYTRVLVDEIARSEDMVARIAAAGARAEVNVFRRFALMRRWNRDGVPLQDLDDGGRLHTSAWATNCVAAALSEAIAAAT